MRALLTELLAVLKAVEWGATRQGAGYGPMGSGGNGPHIPACPLCRGINPKRGRGEFIESALGHTRACQIAIAIEKAEEFL